MTSDEYVNQVNRLMDLQNAYMGIFLAVLGVVLAIMGFLQWRLSDKQVEKIKSETEKKLLDQFNYKLEGSIKENKKTLLNSIRYPLFQTIDLNLMTDIRLIELPSKIEQILHSLEGITEIYDYEYNILESTLLYFWNHEDEVMSNKKRDFVNNYLSIEYIYIFIENRCNEDQKQDDRYKTLKVEMNHFKNKYKGNFEKYLNDLESI
ncbi:hypothetical protein [Oceanobacillus oncorhynchi]|uniref:hypothetical protein n=1 Tax=Oceanobacillus oncorhynchi TaxID=545501 RepID=UPI00186953A3|nr:hypothetical protein [Oceanobacillus oncorhynchi]